MAAGVTETLEDGRPDLGASSDALRELPDSDGRVPSFLLILAFFDRTGVAGAACVLRGGSLGGGRSGLSNCRCCGCSSIFSSSSLLDTWMCSCQFEGRIGLEFDTLSDFLPCPTLRRPEPGAADRCSRVVLWMGNSLFSSGSGTSSSSRIECRAENREGFDRTEEPSPVWLPGRLNPVSCSICCLRCSFSCPGELDTLGRVERELRGKAWMWPSTSTSDSLATGFAGRSGSRE